MKLWAVLKELFDPLWTITAAAWAAASEKLPEILILSGTDESSKAALARSRLYTNPFQCIEN